MKTEIENLNQYLESLFSRKKVKSALPDDSFVTILGNRLNWKFSQEYPPKKEILSSFLPNWFPSWRLAFVPILTFLLILGGIFYFTRSKSKNLANLEATINSLESEIVSLDKETYEITSSEEETIETGLAAIEKM